MRNASILMAVLAIAVPLKGLAQEEAVVEESAMEAAVDEAAAAEAAISDAAISDVLTATNEAFMGAELQIDSEASWLRVLAYPDGPLKRFGHHHVISHNGLSGTVQLAADPLESTISLEFAVAEFVVDDAELRTLEGEDFEKEVKQKDKDGTKENMLGEKLLFGQQFPVISIQSMAIEGSLADATIIATVGIKGMEQVVRFPASIELVDNAFIAVGQLEILHGELGLSPFKAAGGALSVRDLLVLKYEIAGSVVASDE